MITPTTCLNRHGLYYQYFSHIVCIALNTLSLLIQWPLTIWRCPESDMIIGNVRVAILCNFPSKIQTIEALTDLGIFQSHLCQTCFIGPLL
ncbi:hypothetical protein BDZ94DRAFT_885955 [Collybia nuda]|uniref:Uncharacterized protein n=1 Tax=Collybia nuda TaxID=64659 RepID=A0A9P5Y003_9AGAR|nr:hypothetical protein BDZ94DRAFT_885955 [Collybia nuda]